MKKIDNRTSERVFDKTVENQPNTKVDSLPEKGRYPRARGKADPASFVFAMDALREYRWQHATNDEEVIPYIDAVQNSADATSPVSPTVPLLAATSETESDPVDHPAHYESGGIETILVLETVIDGLDAVCGFLLGNVIKYVLRAGKKGDAAEDLAKANNYAHRLVTGHWRWESDAAKGGEGE